MDFLVLDAAIAGLVLGSVCYLAAGIHTIEDDERGVVLRASNFSRVLQPGRAFTLPILDRCIRVSLRPFTLVTEVPMLIVRDGSQVSARLTASCQVLQPEKTVTAPGEYRAAVGELLERVLVDAARELSAAELKSDNGRLGRVVKKSANEVALAWGVDVQEVELGEVAELPPEPRT